MDVDWYGLPVFVKKSSQMPVQYLQFRSDPLGLVPKHIFSNTQSVKKNIFIPFQIIFNNKIIIY